MPPNTYCEGLEEAMKPTWVELNSKSPRSTPAIGSVKASKLPKATLLLTLALLPIAFTAAAADPIGPATQPPSGVTVNPSNAVRGAVVFVTLMAPPKNANTVEVALDATHIPVANPDPNGNYRVVIPADPKPESPSFIPLGKHRVSVIVDGTWFTGNESLDVERPQPAPKLTSISPTYLVGGGSGGTLTLTGSDFATDVPADNQVLFDDAVQPVIWDGCNHPSAWKPQDKTTAHGQVDNRSTIELCNLQLPDKNSVEVNIRQGENDTASGLHLTISHYNQFPIVLWSFGILFICMALVFVLAFFAHKYSIGDTKYGVWSILFLDLETDTYSLSKLQFYLWTDAAILTYSYLVICRLFVQRLDFPDVPSSLPGIIAIGAGTAIGSQFVTNVHGPKGGGPEKPSLGDFVTSGGVAAPDRVQMLVWTIVGVVGFCVASFRLDPWTITTLPQIGDSLMLLMGISSAGYLGGKLARKPGPVLSAISLSPSGPDGAPAGGAIAPAAAADLSQPIAGQLATGVSQAQATPSTSSARVRIIELRGRNLSSDATFEINTTDLPFRMLVSENGIQAPQIVSPEDAAGAAGLARALRLKIDPNALGPSDRIAYNSWFQTGGKDLKFAISNPDGQISEITFTLPPGEQQAHT
jgi:hypothetical protein